MIAGVYSALLRIRCASQGWRRKPSNARPTRTDARPAAGFGGADRLAGQHSLPMIRTAPPGAPRQTRGAGLRIAGARRSGGADPPTREGHREEQLASDALLPPHGPARRLRSVLRGGGCLRFRDAAVVGRQHVPAIVVAAAQLGRPRRDQRGGRWWGKVAGDTLPDLGRYGQKAVDEEVGLGLDRLERVWVQTYRRLLGRATGNRLHCAWGIHNDDDLYTCSTGSGFMVVLNREK